MAKNAPLRFCPLRIIESENNLFMERERDRG